MNSSTSQFFHSICLVLLLPWVKGTDVRGCTFGDAGNNTDGYFRLFPGKPQGRVEVRCGVNEEWGTISWRGTRNTEIVAALVCRKLGYGNGSPIQPIDEFGGFGPVWNVSCDEQHKYIEDCSFTKNEAEKSYDYVPTYPYWDHNDDLHVKCGPPATLDEIASPPENTLMFILVDVGTVVVLLAFIILSGFVVYQLLIRKFKSVRNTKSAS